MTPPRHPRWLPLLHSQLRTPYKSFCFVRFLAQNHKSYEVVNSKVEIPGFMMVNDGL